MTKKMHKEEREMREGEESRSPSHKLNIIDDITNIIILLATSLVILSIKISCHHMICLFESLCNILWHSLPQYIPKKFVCGHIHRHILTLG